MKITAYIISPSYQVEYTWSADESQLALMIEQGNEFIAKMSEKPARFYIESESGKILHDTFQEGKHLTLLATIASFQSEKVLKSISLLHGPPHVRRFCFENRIQSQEEASSLLLDLIEKGYTFTVQQELHPVNLMEYLSLRKDLHPELADLIGSSEM